MSFSEPLCIDSKIAKQVGLSAAVICADLRHNKKEKCIKIGISNNVYTRYNGLQINYSSELTLVKIVTNIHSSLEKRLHKKYDKYRQNGEWFDDCILANVWEDLS